jgi:hypothetical protein
MNYLLAGSEPAARVELLLSLTRINSEDVKAALRDHLVKGVSDSNAIAIHGITKSNFSRALKRLNEVAAIVEQIKDIDWEKFKSQAA